MSTSRATLRLAKAMHAQAERVAKANSVNIRTGRVATVNPAARIAQVRFDGENVAASVRWKGGSAPAVGDTVDVLVQAGSMSILAGGSGSTTQQVTTVVQQTTTTTVDDLLAFMEGGGF